MFLHERGAGWDLGQGARASAHLQEYHQQVRELVRGLVGVDVTARYRHLDK